MMTRTAILVAAVASLVSLPFPACAQYDAKIRIAGRAVVEVAPDFVTVRIGVSTRAPSPTAALDQNSAIARKIIEFSRTFGVAERDIQTDAINLSPVVKTVREVDRIVRQDPDGYAASNTVRVKLSDLSRLGVFMRQVVDQGATNISGVQFGISDPEKATDEARAKAVENAVHQAQVLAQAARVKLGKVLSITNLAQAEQNAADGFASLAVRRPPAQPVPVEAGMLQIAADVEMTWAIE
jgi:uncharacterized protein YggE